VESSLRDAHGYNQVPNQGEWTDLYIFCAWHSDYFIILSFAAAAAAAASTCLLPGVCHLSSVVSLIRLLLAFTFPRR
jgi:hypothetical protein